MNWRVGSKVPINVYEGDRPICQCHTAEDAKRIVAAMNRKPETSVIVRSERSVIAELRKR